jgi:hypothetical protein
MPFERKKPNYTPQLPTSGLVGRITGKNDLAFTRNKYQTAIDNAHAAFQNMCHFMEEQYGKNSKLVSNLHAIQMYRRDVKSSNVKREKLYSNIKAAITQDQNFSERMWKIHQEMFKSSSTSAGNYSQSFKNINVTHEEVRKYVKEYPRTDIRNDLQIIIKMEEESEKKKQAYGKNIAELRSNFDQFKIELNKLESKYGAYNRLLEEGRTAIKSCRFYGSFLYNNLTTAEDKSKYNIDVMDHRVEQFVGTMQEFQKLRDKIARILEVDETNYEKAIAGEFDFSGGLEDV